MSNLVFFSHVLQTICYTFQKCFGFLSFPMTFLLVPLYHILFSYIPSDVLFNILIFHINSFLNFLFNFEVTQASNTVDDLATVNTSLLP